MVRFRIEAFLLVAAIALPSRGNEADDRIVSFQSTSDSVAILVGDKKVATYFLRDPVGEIRRPYFAHVKTLHGIQVTRNQPPGPGDRDDHATMHPGIWLGFGDVSGVDFWRNRGDVRHVAFVQPPTADGNRGGFVQQKRYIDKDDVVICDEEFRFRIHAGADSYLLSFDSAFTCERPFYFGDQEEMGLGIRVATPITEESGGLLQDAVGRSKAKSIWSHSANWCSYGGVIEGREVGIAMFCHPANFRKSWFHARDYGLLVANAFGRAAMKKGEPSRVEVQPGGSLRLRYGVLVHQGYDKDDVDVAYQEYIRQAGTSK
jgi:hypothetical protein